MNYRKNFLKAAFVFITIVCLFALLLFSLTSCGNQTLTADEGSANLNHIHIYDHFSAYCFDIESYTFIDSGILVKKTDNSGGIFCSAGSYQLFKSANDCPYCNGEK